MLDVIRNRLQDRRLTATTVAGREKASGCALRILLLGHGIDMHYLIARAYGHAFEIVAERRIWRHDIPRLIQQTAADMVIGCEVPAHFRRYAVGGPTFFLPRWINGETSLERALTMGRGSGQIGRDRARISKQRFGYELSNDPADYRWFYANMYVPYITNVYGRMGAVAPLAEVEAAIPTSTLLFVTKGGARVAGQILLFQGDSARGSALGVLHGDRTLTRLGAVAALYVYGIEELGRQGRVTRINFGGSRPFLDDGVLQFKRKWGMTLRGTSPTGFLFLDLRDTAGAREFMQNNPFIYENDRGKLVAAIFCGTTGAEKEKGMCRALKLSRFDGIETREIYAGPTVARAPGKLPGSDMPVQWKGLAELFSK